MTRGYLILFKQDFKEEMCYTLLFFFEFKGKFLVKFSLANTLGVGSLGEI